ncbi:N-acetylmuramoyl-L-alanine amidase-like domain-containing protein [Proteiniphilum sp. X52]|uniref:N-acetylmuramoyl-L-alanine amidase-like domain-containing protein n=1 Tax=Proteiniphilum sp. X52 TaxID=2382159 RepID=UPI000F09A529|nr:N-acetylmuramoyl-L-alanine amidase-like domain-containing protein [Proteiniphilum sp. X52]RNC64629.1 DUF1460 domain-containing protein [Proteiniphilum sp. X52]
MEKQRVMEKQEVMGKKRIKGKMVILLSMMMLSPVFAREISMPPEAVYTAEDRLIFDRYIAYVGPWRSAPTDSLLEKTALFFLNFPYRSHTLEMPGEEKLVVNLREFDCTTFVESVIALVRTARSQSPGFDIFLHELQRIRYREGDLRGYASRLHYTSDWFYDNEKKGFLKNSSAGLGGIREEKTIDFMTTHRNAYRQLKNDEVLLQEMQVIENGINERNGLYYLPKECIAGKASLIPHMSMIAFTTSIKGLDVTHVGFAFQEEGRLTFIHASSTREKVVIDQKTLSDYCAGQPSCTGVAIAEVL